MRTMLLLGAVMRRREFLLVLGGAAVMWPLATLAQQQVGQVRRVGVLMAQASGDPEGQVRIAAFLEGLRDLGWVEGRNIRIEYRRF